MLTIIPVTTLTIPDLTPYRTLRQSIDHFRNGMFIAEGEKVVRRLIESPLELCSVLITPAWLDTYRVLLESRPESISAFVGSKELLQQIVGFTLHQGIMALGKIPVQPSLEDVAVRALPPLLFVALDGLTNAENIGVVVRNCAAFGVRGILVGETSSSPYLRRAVRNSMGTIFKVPIIHCDDLVHSLAGLRSHFETIVIAAHPHAEERTLQSINCSKNLCIVFGSEGDGISARVLGVCDYAASIPMSMGVDSLNVASASAVFLYEAAKQRTGKR